MKKIIQFLICIAAGYSAEAQPQVLFRLQASGNSMQNETVVYFDSTASVTYDPLLDAPSLGVDPGYLNIVTWFDSMAYQIKALPSLVQGAVIPVKITTGISGQYQIHGYDLQNLPSGACIILHDNYSGTSHDLRSGDYFCTISDTESIARFSVNIIISMLPAPSSSLQNPTCSTSPNGRVIAHAIGSGPWNYYWKDSANNVIRAVHNKAGSDTLTGIGSGFYRVEVNTPGTCSNGASDFTLEGALSPKASFVADTLVGISSNVQFTNASSNAVSYLWQFGDGMGTTYTNPSHSYSAANLYTVTLSAFSSVCNETATVTKTLMVVGSTVVEQANEEALPVIGRDAKGYYVALSGTRSSQVSISVCDMMGKSLFSVNSGLEAESKVYMDVAQYRNTVLLVHVLAGSQIVSKKIVVE